LRKNDIEKGKRTMSKVFRFVLVAALAVAFIAPLSGVQAKQPGEKDVWPVYYSLTDPGNTPLGEGDWVGPVPVGLPLGPLATSTTIWIGCKNEQYDEWRKEWYIELKGARIFDFGAVDVVAYDSFAVSTKYNYSPIAKSMLVADSTVRFNVKIWPQPHWEVMELHVDEPGPVTINNIIGYSECGVAFDIPALTTYGIIVLVLLLLVSTVWVIRKKRAHVPA